MRKKKPPTAAFLWTNGETWFVRFTDRTQMTVEDLRAEGWRIGADLPPAERLGIFPPRESLA